MATEDNPPQGNQMHDRKSANGFLTDLLSQLEEATPELSLEAIPIALGELERLRTTLWARLFNPQAVPAPQPNGEDRLLGVADAAKLLGISKTALRRLETSGALSGVRIGRRLLFRREVLVRFAEDHERAGGR